MPYVEGGKSHVERKELSSKRNIEIVKVEKK